jgi:hypothetical protein
MAKTLLPFLLLLLLLFGCNNYGLRDQLENPGGTSSAPPPVYRIFVTAGNPDGNLGGIIGADSQCQNDGANPDTSRTWKAMLVGGVVRRACSTANCSGGISENIDWVLRPKANYVRPDGTLIGSTNDRALLTFPLSNSIGISGVQPWTGLNTDWTTDGTKNCSNWTTDFNEYGRVGQANLTVSEAIDVSNIRACDDSGPLYCVEQ